MGIEKPNRKDFFKLREKGWLKHHHKNVESSDGVKKLPERPESSYAKTIEKYSNRYKSIYGDLRLSEPIIYDGKSSLELIKAAYYENKFDVILLTRLGKAIDDFEFIDFVIEKKVPFTSRVNKPVTESISEAFLYISKKKALGRGGNKNAGVSLKNSANDFSLKIGPLIDDLETEGHKSFQAKADELNARNIKTLRGKEWSSMTVKRTHERWQKLKEEKTQKQKSPKPE
jgi:hypothetical protein